VLLKALKSPDDSLVCPIKLLLALALRLGNVPESSIEDLIAHTRQRKNHTVLWSFPERPVHCAFTTNGAALIPDKPAGNHQLTHTMAQAGLVAGVLCRLRAHDLRRGAARDTANLKSKAKGAPSKGATAVLGHSFNSTNMPLTAHYVGALADDLWTKRINENFDDPIYEMEEAENPYQRKFQALRPQQIVQTCRTEGLDENNPLQRKEASKLCQKRRQADWADQERRKRQSIEADSQEPPSRYAADIMVNPGVFDEDALNDLDAVDNAFIDPQLLQQSQDLSDFIVGTGNVATNPQIEGLVFDTVQGIASPPDEVLTSDTLGFVRRFSAINISCNQTLVGWGKTASAARVKTLLLIEGNSRDKVTSFIYACQNQVHGCSYVNGNRVEIYRHEQVCTITSREIFNALAQKEAGKRFKCTVGECTKGFDTIGKLNSHVKELHEYPKSCHKGCDPQTLYNTRNEYLRHLETHSQFTPTSCLVPGCTSTTVFERAQMYRKHVRKSHEIQGKAIDQYMPYEKKAKFTPTQCRVPLCSSKATFKLPNQYKAHLREKHSMGEDEIQRLVD